MGKGHERGDEALARSMHTHALQVRLRPIGDHHSSWGTAKDDADMRRNLITCCSERQQTLPVSCCLVKAGVVDRHANCPEHECECDTDCGEGDGPLRRDCPARPPTSPVAHPASREEIASPGGRVAHCTGGPSR